MISIDLFSLFRFTPQLLDTHLPHYQLHLPQLPHKLSQRSQDSTNTTTIDISCYVLVLLQLFLFVNILAHVTGTLV